MDLKDKVILVTGSSSGIGQATAIECARHGSTVLIHYHNNKQGAQDTLTEVVEYSAGQIYSADLSKSSEVTRLFEQIFTDHPRIDALVNNAGAAAPGKLDDLATWESQWHNIFMSQVYAVNEFLKQGKSKDLKKIINIGSVYGLSDTGNPDFPQYSAMKAAVVSLTANLAKQLAPFVLVNAVAPGYTLTPAWAGTPKAELEACKNLTRIKRFVEPSEIATAVVFLLHNDAVTGEVIRVDGGLHLTDIR